MTTSVLVLAAILTTVSAPAAVVVAILGVLLECLMIYVAGTSG